MVNRAFFMLISLSLVSASSRLAYDQLGGFRPTFLRCAWQLISDSALLQLQCIKGLRKLADAANTHSSSMQSLSCGAVNSEQ
jgi:hypothetical protein